MKSRVLFLNVLYIFGFEFLFLCIISNDLISFRVGDNNRIFRNIWEFGRKRDIIFFYMGVLKRE